MRSEVWKYFGFEVDESGVIKDKKNVWCRVCEARVAYSGNTSNLASHIGKCQKNQSVAGLSSTVKQMRQTKSVTSCSKKGQEATLALVKFLAKDMCSVDFVHGVGFRDLINILCPYFEIPKPDILTRYIESMVEEKKKVIMQELSSVQYVSISVDVWTSLAVDSYMEVTCHFVDDNWILQTRPLEVKQLEQSYTFNDVTLLLRECEEKWCLEGKVVAYVTSNLAEAVEAMAGNHIRCIAHFLQQTVTDALKTPDVTELVDKARRIICHLRQFNIIEVTPENSEALRRLPELDVDGQWKSTYDMLRDLKEHWKDVCAALLEQEFQFNDDEIISMERLCTLLEPLTEVATYLGGKKFASVAVVYPICQSLLKSLAAKVDDTSCIRNFKTAMQESLKQRMEPMDHLMVHAAALHPQFKFLRFIPKEEHEDVWYEIKAQLFALYMVNGCVSGEGTKDAVTLAAEAEKPPPKKRGLLDDSDDEGEEQHCIEKEVTGYGQEKKSEIDAGIWWKTNCIKYPFLAQLAKRYLSVVATSVPCYELFGMEDCTCREKRMRLFGANTKDIIFLHTYLQHSVTTEI